MSIPIQSTEDVMTRRHRTETWDMFKKIKDILSKHKRLSVRQIFYQCATKNYVSLDINGYERIGRLCSQGRLEGILPWDKIVDRSRFPTQLNMWDSVGDFYSILPSLYRRNIWLNQPNYFEVWMEKSALYDIFYDQIFDHGILLMTVRGYSSLSIIYERSLIFKKYIAEGRKCKILYFGDHDPNGIQIDKSIRSTFRKLNVDVDIERIALTYDDIFEYNLPTNIEKEEDTNLDNYKLAGYVLQAELDALPVEILEKRIINSVTDNLDMDKYKEYKELEKRDLQMVSQDLGGIINKQSE
ncbi:MAG: hypothetical protein LAN71_17050 [Acidobacteriia bacterium]|nr:hypothetical protein [Terriglobia bacterium]